MVVGNTPAAEISIDEALVRGLLADQHPDLSALPLAPLASGWDNVLYRLGDALTVRLPRRQAGADLVANEQRWLPELAPRLPLPIPAPVRCGAPGRGFPWHWSVCPWFEGEIAADTPPDDFERAARDLGAFLAALHRPAPSDAPRNPVRGGPLPSRTQALEERLERLAGLVDSGGVRARWVEWVDTPAWPGPPIWLHGDLHPANLLVNGGRIAAVIDFGDITAGDPATDLSLAWFLLPAEFRPTFRAAAGDVDDATWLRARAWALSLAIAWLSSSADSEMMQRVGMRALRQAMTDG